MKNYNLGEYMLRSGEVVMFPITSEEINILKNGKGEFETYFKMPYIAGEFNTPFLEKIKTEVNMENPYWFLNSLWVIAHIKSKEIFGTIRLKKDIDTTRVYTNITMLLDAQETYSEAVNLFVKFLSVNGYQNIYIEGDKECI